VVIREINKRKKKNIANKSSITDASPPTSVAVGQSAKKDAFNKKKPNTLLESNEKKGSTENGVITSQPSLTNKTPAANTKKKSVTCQKD